MHHSFAATSRVALALFFVAILSSVSLAGDNPGRWTEEMTDSYGPIVVPGVEIKNFGVVDGHIFRGRQPDEEDYAALKRFGIRTIIDLRGDAKSWARQEAEAAGLRYINIPMDDKDRPYDNQIAEFLKAVTNPDHGKVYVHCAGGRHRTGATIAVYRMAIEGWSAEDAYNEMKAYDFYTRWGHKGYKTYVFDYFNRMQTTPASVPASYEGTIVTTPFTEVDDE